MEHQHKEKEDAMGQRTVDASYGGVAPLSLTDKIFATIGALFVGVIVVWYVVGWVDEWHFKHTADAELTFTLGMYGDDAVLTSLHVAQGDYVVSHAYCAGVECAVRLETANATKDMHIALHVRPTKCAPCIDAIVNTYNDSEVEVRNFGMYDGNRREAYAHYYLKLKDPEPGAEPHPTVVACR